MLDREKWLDRGFLIRFCVLVCIFNIILVLSLAGTGVLKTAQPDDVTFLEVEETPNGAIESTVAPFAVERPTDVDAFYDAVVRVMSGGPLYNPWGDAHTIQRFHYSPIVYFLFVPFYYLGYLGFKVGWLLFSVGLVMTGTFLVLRAETEHRGIPLTLRETITLSAGSIGFSPAVTNFKTGQTGVLLYFSVAAFWWYYRRHQDTLSGGFLVLAALVKPYMASPLVLSANRRRFRGIIGFVIVFGLANLAGVLAFGFETLVLYYEILLEFAIGDSTAAPAGGPGFDDWFASSLRPLAGVGPLAGFLRLAVFVSFAYVSLRHLLDYENRPAELFSLSLVSVMLFIHGASVTDAVVLLAVFIVLGARLYPYLPAFGVLVLAFLAFEVHPYVMEALVGWGPENVGIIASNEAVIMTFVPFLQPGLYGLLGLFGLVFYSRRMPLGEIEPLSAKTTHSARESSGDST